MKIRFIKLFLMAFSATLPMAFPIYAQEAEPDAPFEPEVTITQRGDDTVEEFRAHGQLYMIKVKPKRGAPYYLVDMDGDGTLESRRGDLGESDVVVPQWILFRWK